MKILIAVPTFDGHIEIDTVKAICAMCRDFQADFLPVHGYDVASARNYIANYALNNEYDAVLMIDSDTVPPDGALEMLLEGDYPIKVGTYIYGLNRSLTVASRVDEENTLLYDESRLIPAAEVCSYNGKSVLIGGSGMGCALIKTDVFRRLPYPWFRWVTYDNGDELGEDCYFAELCRTGGVPMMLDSRVLCGHIKPQTLNVQEGEHHG